MAYHYDMTNSINYQEPQFSMGSQMPFKNYNTMEVQSALYEEEEDDTNIYKAVMPQFVRHNLKMKLLARNPENCYDTFKVPQPRYRKPVEATEDDMNRKRLRRERNKLAAMRCRNRRRENIERLEKETERLTDVQDSILENIASLTKQKDQLLQILNAHKCALQAQPPNTVSSASLLLQGMA
ncbi:Transforming protein v-Fos/v-Fox [Trichoplax sp. H2]|nr:Transforming protein v-Fos/v-Fox [Trichoplax sp. H2]|eukprot:RDD40306.1 Transforming protein v-Fos/v-Fox [Trichoplax sp. H2]